MITFVFIIYFEKIRDCYLISMGMKRLIFVICAILCSSLFVSAKDFREVVYLKNGSIIKGIILEQIPNETIKIETSDGSAVSYTHLTLPTN